MTEAKGRNLNGFEIMNQQMKELSTRNSLSRFSMIKYTTFPNTSNKGLIYLNQHKYIVSFYPSENIAITSVPGKDF